MNCENLKNCFKIIMRTTEPVACDKLSGAVQPRVGNRSREPELFNSPVAPYRLSCQIVVNQREAETNAKSKAWFPLAT